MERAQKLPFDIDEVMARIANAVKDLPKAAMFELADRGCLSAFQQMVGCVISVRTYDEVTVPVALRLFERARTPEQMACLSVEEIDNLIAPCTFHENKSRQIKEMAERTMSSFGGEVPCDAESLMSFRGVGIKCTNLVLGIACGLPRVSVDTHVHRVTNRWGYVRTTTPEKTTAVLEEKLPERYKIDINRLLVPFGKRICTRLHPKCPLCPVHEWCRQVGVG